MGLAQAVGLPIVEKRVIVPGPWSWFPAGLVPVPLWALSRSGDPVAPPWPRLIVSCGRRSIGPALAVKRRSGGRTVAAYVQNPELSRSKFDLVVALPHDGVSGDNVVTVRTALHPITHAALGRAREEWRTRLNPEGTRLIGVLVGGDNGRYRLTAAIVAKLVRLIERINAEHGFKAAITPSRRTGVAVKRALAEAFRSENWVQLWDERDANPYLGVLALSDRMIVTGESISMISEALATGHPVHVMPLEGQGRRHDAFLGRIADENLVSLIEGDDLDWQFLGPGPVHSTVEPALRLRALVEIRRYA
jgi:mitochondrial fission protein ELM1